MSLRAQDGERIQCRIYFDCKYGELQRHRIYAAPDCIHGEANCKTNNFDPYGRKFLDRCEYIGTYLVHTAHPGAPDLSARLCGSYEEIPGIISPWWVCGCRIADSEDPISDLLMGWEWH
ncbi:MAG: hypothetical protein COV44_04390 [Deltaproteobacteria bacterium CG11_big_fil_rev_8_21_14_0_20_45_16]|nr:MAG: hypothetical protein COV44_04390 [Deltaproteobacteria bacterium CG11_big_fil_rev_8_21_14_0_20_45_16]